MGFLGIASPVVNQRWWTKRGPMQAGILTLLARVDSPLTNVKSGFLVPRNDDLVGLCMVRQYTGPCQEGIRLRFAAEAGFEEVADESYDSPYPITCETGIRRLT